MRARDPALVGAFFRWAFDIAVLYACFKAFGESPPGGVVVMGYLTGALRNVVPLPGGLGGVEGAMIGAFLARLRAAAAHGPGVGRQRDHAKHVMTGHLLRRENSRASENTSRSGARRPTGDDLP